MASVNRYEVGDIVEHKLFGYRGVVFDVHDEFELTDEWYDKSAQAQPPKDCPWYQILVHNAAHTTYVAQQNLDPSSSEDQVNHPELGKYFCRFVDGQYE